MTFVAGPTPIARDPELQTLVDQIWERFQALEVEVAYRRGAESKAMTLLSPTNAEDITLFRVEESMLVEKLTGALVGSGGPSVSWTVRWAADRSATGTEIITGGTTTTSTTTGDEVTSFNEPAIPAESFVWIETSAVAGTVDSFSLTIEYTVD